MNEALQDLYYRFPLPTAYASIDKLERAIARKGYSRRKTLEWLEAQNSYNQHKNVRRRFPRRVYNVRNFDDLWEADLMDLRSLKTYNNGVSYILIVIDALSKYAWAEPMFNKTSKSVANALARILSKSNNRKPVCLQTDKGKEFLGREMQDFLGENKINFRVARSPDTKAAIAERLIRTIKEKIWRYFTYTKTRRYIDMLQKIMESYNQSKHSATRMTPASVTLANAAEARRNIQQKYGSCTFKQPKYSVGDIVRVSRAKRAFEKGYVGSWSEELFKIDRISTTNQPPVYFLKDLSDEEIVGFFYEQELSRVRKNLADEIFEIDKILRTVGKGAQKRHLVSWKGYPTKFDSWVNATDIKKLQ